MYDDGLYSDTTSESSPATIRRQPVKSSPKNTTGSDMSQLSSKDFLPEDGSEVKVISLSQFRKDLTNKINYNNYFLYFDKI